MELLTSAVEKKLVSMNQRQPGLPSKHQLGIGMVYRHVRIRAPPSEAFLPIDRCSEDQKKLVSAWELLRDHLLEPFKTNANWSHADATKWAEGDEKTPKKLHDSKTVLFPPVLLAETPAMELEDGTKYKGTVRVFILDPFSYYIQATCQLPNILTITGTHILPSAEDLPIGTAFYPEAPVGRWKRVIEVCIGWIFSSNARNNEKTILEG